jgi:hypothetical protein
MIGVLLQQLLFYDLARAFNRFIINGYIEKGLLFRAALSGIGMFFLADLTGSID